MKTVSIQAPPRRDRGPAILLPELWSIDRLFLQPPAGVLPSPVLQASLADIGIEPTSFLDFVRPFFDDLGWDHYDVRRCRLELLFEATGGFGAQPLELQHAARAYFVSGELSDALGRLRDGLPAAKRAEFEALRPWRARAAARFEAEPTGSGGLVLRQIELGPFRQAVADYRGEPRMFELMSPALLRHELIRHVVAAWARLAYLIRPELEGEVLEMVFHQMKTTVGPEALTSQVVPEKVHQDGVDGILVPLLVVERSGIAGGRSQLYSLPNDQGKKDLLWQGVLTPGHFQVFDDRQYFHGVEPISLAPGAVRGCRAGLGVDILVRR
jgi:hypothetical protein